MSGHSKWSNIRGKKAVIDAKKGKLFTQLVRNIRSAVRETGVNDPENNPALRMAIDKARQANMPHENIHRAIDRGLGKGDAGQLEEIIYEAYDEHGVGYLIIVRTDNKMRTGSEIRAIIERHRGSLGGPGSTMYLFSRIGNTFSVQIPFAIKDQEVKESIHTFVDALEDHDDVEVVHINADLEKE